MLRFKSIKNKIVIISLIITTLTFISVCLMTLMQIDKELQENLKTEIELTGNLVSQKILASINETVGIIDNVKKSVENGNTDVESIKRYLYTVADAYPETIPTGIYCGLENGIYIDKMWTPDDPEWVMKERPWYIEGKKADRVTFGETYMDGMTGSYIVSVYVNLKDKNENVIGVISADISIDNISNILTSQTILENGYVYAVDQYSGMVFGNKVEENLNGVFLSESDNKFLQALSERIANEEYGVVVEFEENYYRIAKVEGTNFVAVSVVPKSDIDAVLKSIAVRVLAISALGIILSLAGIFVLLTLCLRPLIKIRNLINSMHNLDLTCREERNSEDEFGIIINHLNDLSDKLQETISTFKGVASNLNESAKDNKNGATEIETSTEKQNESVLGLTETVGELLRANENIADGATQLASEVNTLALNVESTENKVNETFGQVQEGSTQINDMTENMKSVYGISKDLENSVDDLNSGLHGITEMVVIIKDIADQTNLLSLNASIEAARAGEQGRGFAVVASEIRSLSDSCQNSVVSIEETIQKLTKLVNVVMGKAKENLTIIENSEKQADKVSSSFNVIKGNVESISESTKDISKSIKTVDTVAAEMAAITKEQAASTEVVMTMVDEINDDANKIANQGKEILGISTDLQRFVDNLENHIGNFKIKN